MRELLLSQLPERGKEPTSVSILNNWVQQAQSKAELPSDRLGWLVASTVVVAVLQRALHSDGHPRFLLKGGVYLEHRLGLNARNQRCRHAFSWRF
jgi:hypothetical protein